MLTKPVPAHLFSNQTIELAPERSVEHDVVKTIRGSAYFYEAGEFAAWRSERNSDRLPLTGKTGTGSLYGLPKLLRQTATPLASLGRGGLECDGEKPILIACSLTA